MYTGVHRKKLVEFVLGSFCKLASEREREDGAKALLVRREKRLTCGQYRSCWPVHVGLIVTNNETQRHIETSLRLREY